MQEARRGTTPTIVAKVPVDLTGYELHLSIGRGSKRVERREDEMEVTVEDGSTVMRATLTQDETLAMRAGSACPVQLRALSPDGVAVATNIKSFKVLEVTENGVI